MVFWLEDDRGEKTFFGGCCSVYVSMFLFYSRGALSVCVCTKKRDGTKRSYLCNLSSSSFIYLVVFSFRRLSVWRESERELVTCAAFISRDLVSEQQITALIPLKLSCH